MIRLPAPPLSYSRALEICIEGIPSTSNFRSRVAEAKTALIDAAMLYEQEASNGALYRITPLKDNYAGEDVVADLTSADLVRMYEQYLVPKNVPARHIYEALLSASLDRCPLCGIGVPRNLDHFLPKRHFPQYVVFPKNLVPSCRDCNMDGKAQRFAKTAEEQIIHPYSDHPRFFTEQWIQAIYTPAAQGKPGVVSYSVAPPADWSHTDKTKVRKHFADFNLAGRFGIKAAQQLHAVLAQMETAKREGSYEFGRMAILEPMIEHGQFINHWQLIMYQALLAHFEKLP